MFTPFSICAESDDCAWCHSFRPEERGRAQGVGIKLPRHVNESAIRLLRAQHVETARCLAFETLGHQAGARLRPCQVVGVFGGVEEGEVGRACSIERCDICNDVIEASPVTKFGSCRAAISPTVKPTVCLKKSGSVIPSAPRDNLKRTISG